MKKVMFVYGTLKRGFSNHRLMGQSKYLGKTLVPGLKMFSMGGFPGCIKSGDNDDEVIGELYEVTSEEVLQDLDWLEGHPDFYRRTEVNTFHGIAETYLVDPSYIQGRSIVSDGDWK